MNPRVEKFLLRYIFDCESTIKQMQYLVKPKGDLFVVIGNSTQYGTNILNDKIFKILGSGLGFSLVDEKRRSIPSRSRYLPITSNGNQISKRMKTEKVLHFIKA